MKVKVTVLPGDGIGPEVTAQAVRVLETIASISGYSFEFSEHLVGGAAIRAFGSPLPRPRSMLVSTATQFFSAQSARLNTISCHRISVPKPVAFAEKSAGSYANLRPAVSYSSIAACSPLRTEVSRGADILIVRELLGGLYFGEPRGFEGNKRVVVGYEHHALFSRRDRTCHPGGI